MVRVLREVPVDFRMTLLSNLGTSSIVRAFLMNGLTCITLVILRKLSLLHDEFSNILLRKEISLFAAERKPAESLGFFFKTGFGYLVRD